MKATISRNLFATDMGRRTCRPTAT